MTEEEVLLSVLYILKKMERWEIHIKEEYAKVEGRTVKLTFGLITKLRLILFICSVLV